MKTSIAALVFFFACPFVIAQSSAAQQAPSTKALSDAAWARAGCGSNDIHFEVAKVRDKAQHPFPQPEVDRAMVYVFEDDETMTASPTTRVGLDGKWMGGNVPGSYFFFPIESGAHRLCINWQGWANTGGALDFKAEAGKIYYFRSTFILRGTAFDLKQVDDAEGQFLIASHLLSSSKPKTPDGQGE